MLTVTKSQIKDALEAIGIRRNDGLFMHSAIQYLGVPENGIGDYLNAVVETIGAKGTVAVPTFTFKFAETHTYDPGQTASAGMGLLSELIRKDPRARRTLHPMQSIAALGKDAVTIANLDTPGAFDAGSGFEFMIKKGYKVLLCGADIQAVSLLHYCEQRANVPYRYWKDFPGKIKVNGKWEERSYRMFVRDLKTDPHLTLKPVEKLLRQEEKWHEHAINYGFMAAFDMKDFVECTDRILQADPWALVEN